MIVQALANGLVQGLWIAVLALSFALVYRPTGIFYMALAGLYAAVPFVSKGLGDLGCPTTVASALAVLAGTGLSLACQWLNHEPLTRKRAPPGVHLVSSLGLYIVIHQGIALIWGPETRTLEHFWDVDLSIGPIQLSPPQTFVAVTTTLTLIAMGWFLLFSDIGLRLRAHADNPSDLALLGYSLPRLRTICFGLSGFLCAVASLLAAHDLGFDPYAGLPAFLLAVVAVMAGGNRTLWGPCWGGILVGVVRALVVCLFSSRWQDASTFLLLAAVLLLRPRAPALLVLHGAKQ